MSKHILLIEDDRNLLKIYSDKLSKEGFLVDIASTVDEALRKMQSSVPALIFLDLILPNKDGFEFLEERAKLPKAKDIPVVVLSNLGQEIDMRRTKTLGAVAYLIKANISLEDLVATAKKYL